MQKVVCLGLLFIGWSCSVIAQTAPAESATPSWLPKEKPKSDTVKVKHQSVLSSIVSGLDPVVSGSVPGAGKKSSSASQLFGETIPDLGLRVKEFQSQKEIKKIRKERAKLAKVQYEGIPMETMSIKYGSGDKATVEIFHVLKSYQPISAYVLPANIRWYDVKKKKLSSSLIKNEAEAKPLHGSYKKYSGENLIEEGYYFLGSKDGRWVKYDSKFNLVDKSLWEKGFPAESRITYYDSTHSHIKEVVPVMFGQVEGDFLQFYKEGQLMASGKYQNGEKIGRWVEYYQFKRLRKKETQYRKTSWDEGFEPFILREWDDKGKLLYDYTKDPRASADEDETEN